MEAAKKTSEKTQSVTTDVYFKMNDNNVQLTFDLGDEVSLNRDDFIVSTQIRML